MFLFMWQNLMLQMLSDITVGYYQASKDAAHGYMAGAW